MLAFDTHRRNCPVTHTWSLGAAECLSFCKWSVNTITWLHDLASLHDLVILRCSIKLYILSSRLWLMWVFEKPSWGGDPKGEGAWIPDRHSSWWLSEEQIYRTEITRCRHALCYLSSQGFKSSLATTSSAFTNIILTAKASVRNIKYMELMCRGVIGRR